MDTSMHKFQTQELNNLFEQYSDFEFFNSRKLQILELNNGEIPEEINKELTHIYIYNDIKSIKRNKFPPELRQSHKVLSFYDLRKFGIYNIPYCNFSPFVNTQEYKLNNNIRPNQIITDFQGNLTSEDYNNSKFVFISLQDELNTFISIIKAFLCGCQPIIANNLENFSIENLLVILDFHIESFNKEPPEYSNSFRGELAEKYGYMEQFIYLEELIKKVLK